MTETQRTWTVQDHLQDMPVTSVELYRAVETAICACGPVVLSPSKTTITFEGARRGFASARPTRHGVTGYLDLTRSLAGDPRIRSVAPHTSRLHVNHYQLRSSAEIGETFLVWVREAYGVGQGDHLR